MKLKYKIRNNFYKLKCFIFKRYTTHKPRTLYHTYSDMTEQLPHMMFELLSVFLEKECDVQLDGYPGKKCIADWYAEECQIKINVNNEEKFIFDEMWELYYWWNNEYIPFFKEEHKILKVIYELMNEHEPTMEFYKKESYRYYEMEFIYKSYSDKVLYEKYLNRLYEFRNEMNNKLKEMMIRLINVKDYMWT